jgi:uncharacterized membrane protein
MNTGKGATTAQQAPAPPRTRASFSTRADWLVPLALIVLSAVPFIAGVIRLVGLAGGAEVTPENARFFAAPLPVVLHILSATPFCILGAFQFASGFRRRWPGWHRVAGRLLVLCGLAAGLSGLWMTLFYPLYPRLQGELLFGFRLLFGSGMVLSMALGLRAILRRDIARHRAWMIRGYALGQGAGTQALTFLLWFLSFGTPSALTSELLMGASWAINLAVAEWIIRRGSATGRARRGANVWGAASASAVTWEGAE